MKHRPFLPLLAIALLTLGCVRQTDYRNIQGRATRAAPVIQASRTLGQTFVAHHDGLSEVEVLLVIYDGATEAEGPITLHLREEPAAGTDLATAAVDPEEYEHNAPYRFTFPPLHDSGGNSYYLLVDAPGTDQGRASLWTSPVDAYPDGTLHVDGEPTQGDLTFKTFYEYGPFSMIRDLLRGLWRQGGLVVPALLLLLLPGHLLLAAVPSHAEVDLVEHLALAVGLSVAAVPVIVYLISLAGLRLGPTITRIGLALAAAAALWRGQRQLRQIERHHFSDHEILFLGIFSIGLATRFLLVRDLAAPMGADSVHHTLISRLIYEGGSVPASYRPYLSIEPFAYHFGFHAVVASFSWLTGMEVLTSVLIVGQLLNAGMILTTHLLTVELTEDRRAGLIAALIVATLSTVGGYLANWGRYTLTAGFLLLPVSMVLILRATQDRVQPQYIGLAVLVASGLLLTHPRVSVFFAAFTLIYLLWRTYYLRRDAERLLKDWLRIGGIALSTLVLTLPYLWDVFRYQVVRVWRFAAEAKLLTHNVLPKDLLTAGHDEVLLAVAGLGMLIGLWRRRRVAFLMGGWTALMFLSANPSSIGIRAGGMVTNATVVTTLYLPAVVLIGLLASEAADAVSLHRRPRFCRAAIALVCLLLSVLGGRGLLQRINPAAIYVYPPDRAAIDWVRANTPVDARFLISAQPWIPGAYIGTDAGYWLPVLGERETTLPPEVYPFAPAAYVARVNEVAEATTAYPLDVHTIKPLLREADVTHVYVGRRASTFSPAAFTEDPDYQTIYSRGGAYVFRFESLEASARPHSLGDRQTPRNP